MFDTIEAWSGKNAYKGKYVPNPGKANGVIIRRATGIKKGNKYDKIEIREVFKSKKGKWTMQCEHSNTGPYGHMKWVTFQNDTLRDVIKCLNEMYAEIYGSVVQRDRSPDCESGDIGSTPIRPSIPPAKSEQLEELKKLGF